MKILISRPELVNLISKLQSIVPLRPATPILGNILLEALDDQLIMIATDLSVSMRAFAEARVLKEGSIAIPARRFFQLARELTAPQIEIEAPTAEAAFIHAGTSHFKMSGMHKNEFPALPDLSSEVSIQLNNGLLRDLLIRSSFAAARDDNRQVLNGILLQNIQQQTSFVGTDGKRLARIQTEIAFPAEYTASHIIPLKAVEEMVKLLENRDEISRLIFMKNKIALESGPITLITKLLSGQYPDVGRVIPAPAENPIILHREELISLLRQVALFTSETSSAVRFSFMPGELHLSAVHNEVGEGKVSMAVNYGGPKFDVAFNPNYFLDILKHIKDEAIHFTLRDPFNPGLVTDSTSAQFVIMPMRLEGVS